MNIHSMSILLYFWSFKKYIHYVLLILLFRMIRLRFWIWIKKNIYRWSVSKDVSLNTHGLYLLLGNNHSWKKTKEIKSQKPTNISIRIVTLMTVIAAEIANMEVAIKMWWWMIMMFIYEWIEWKFQSEDSAMAATKLHSDFQWVCCNACI